MGTNPTAPGVQLTAKALPPFAPLRAFEAVGRLGGIRLAAKALSLHHAVVSRHMASLEEWLGVPLLERQGRPGELSPEGARFHAKISASLADIAAATSEIMRKGEEARLNVWTNGGLAAKWLRRQLTAFIDAYPGLDIELRPTDVRPDLSRHEADVDVRYIGDDYSEPAGGKGVRCLQLARPAIYPVASPAIAAGLADCPAAALLEVTQIQEEHDGQWQAWFRHYATQVPTQLSGPRLWHAHLAIEAAVDGRGVALASDFLVSDELSNGRLVRIVPREAVGAPAILGGYVFMAREDRWNAPSFVRFRNWVQKEMTAAMAGR